ncbi:hypothetical protein UlMin_036469 [Ulmus minor]
MGKLSQRRWLCLINVCSVLFMLSLANQAVGSSGKNSLSWSRRAAEEAELVAAIDCSGHGRAYLDGLLGNGSKYPVCECNRCYESSDCSKLQPDCSADATSGDPYFLEPFWMKQAAQSAILESGWHRMGYSFSDGTYISKRLENHIRELHKIVGNAIVDGRYIIFGSGSTQLLNAAVHALSSDNISDPATVLASIPYYGFYERQTDFFQSTEYKFDGDVNLWRKNSNASKNIIEFVTSPNNPDGKLKEAVLKGPNAKAIYDHVYYWPHFTPIASPADEDLMIFSISKLTGHAGTRFGWAIVKDKAVFDRMTTYVGVNTQGVSRDAQTRVLQLLKTVIEGRSGREIFDFGYRLMRTRWIKLNQTLSRSTRFSLQKLEPQQYCTFFHKVRSPTPAYAWVKCEREEDKDCYAIFEAAKITGRSGSNFGTEDRYVRLSLIRSQDDFDLLIQRLNKLVLI